MTDYTTTWWELTDKITEWIEHPSGNRNRSSIFRCVETGEERKAGDLPVGALYVVDRSDVSDPDCFPPVGAEDGKSIACVMIGNSGPQSRHHWYIDHRASNCTLPNDRKHRCWVRHGTVGGKLTVDKNGLTCGAGAGSVYMDNMRWHGSLRDGVLKEG